MIALQISLRIFMGQAIIASRDEGGPDGSGEEFLPGEESLRHGYRRATGQNRTPRMQTDVGGSTQS